MLFFQTKKMVSEVVARRCISDVLVLRVFHEVSVLKEVACLVAKHCIRKVT